MSKGCANLLTNMVVLIILISVLMWIFGGDDDDSKKPSKPSADAEHATTRVRPSDSLPSNNRAIELVKALPCDNKQIGKDTVAECLQVGIDAGYFEDLGWSVERRYHDLRVINKRRYTKTVTDQGDPLIEVNEWSIDSKMIHDVSPSAGHITANPLGNPYK
ncbi:hypothetical protein ACFL00_02080 [Pseudomonadota bacterium]